MNITDDDLTLRALEPSDSHMLYELMGDPSVEGAVVGWSGPVSLASQETWIQSVTPAEFRYVIDLAGSPCGVAQLSPVDLKNRTASLHIKLRSDARGKGLGSRTIALLLHYGFFELDLELMVAEVLAGNQASRALFENAGFAQDALLPSRVYKNGKRHALVVYSLSRSDYYK